MPGTAFVFCMKQHMGHNSCPYCFIKSYHKNKGMLVKVKKAFILQENDSFKNVVSAGKLKQVVTGLKSSTPLNSFLSLPWDCPVDQMHQVFLGTGKVLSKMLISLVKGKFTTLLQEKFQILGYPNVKFRKAHDFKLFFHTGLLVLYRLGISDLHYASFCRLSIAIRLLSDLYYKEGNLGKANALRDSFFFHFFWNFTAKTHNVLISIQ